MLIPNMLLVPTQIQFERSKTTKYESKTEGMDADNSVHGHVSSDQSSESYYLMSFSKPICLLAILRKIGVLLSTRFNLY